MPKEMMWRTYYISFLGPLSGFLLERSDATLSTKMPILLLAFRIPNNTE